MPLCQSGVMFDGTLRSLDCCPVSFTSSLLRLQQQYTYWTATSVPIGLTCSRYFNPGRVVALK